MAGRADFTSEEWAVMQRAVVGAPLLVAVSDGGRWDLGQALDALSAAVATLRAKAPDELDSFRYFVLDLAKTAAAAARSGPFGLTGPLVSEREAAAVDRIKAAIGIR